MSMYNNILGIYEEIGKLASRLAAVEQTGAKATSATDETVTKFIGEELNARVDSKITEEVSRLLDAKFQGTIDTTIDAKLDAKLDVKLDTKVSTAVRRERPFMETAITDSAQRTILELMDARMRTLRLETEAKIKEAVAAVLEATASKAAPEPAPEPAPAPEPEALPEAVPPSAPEPASDADDSVVIVPRSGVRRTRKAKA